MIEVKGLGKSYVRRRKAGLQVLENVSLSVGDGEFLGIIGPSGCGKTTLLKIIAGLASYDDGEITISGQPFTGCGPDRRMVFQDFALLPWRTVSGNVAFGLEAMKIDKAERQERVRAVLAKTGLTDFEGYFPNQLSGGMQQRVGLARALAVDAETLLMDEPFGALDAQTRRLLQEDLLGLVEGSGRSVVMVTHDMDEAVLLCDRILIMAARPGRIVQELRVSDVLPRPRAGRVDELKAEPAYAELVNHIWSQLQHPSDVDPSVDALRVNS